MSNQIQYYIEYLSSWFYHNVLYTETTVVLLKSIVFVILLTLIVYENYFAAGVVVVICAAAYLYYAGALQTGPGPGPGPAGAVVSAAVARRVEKDELTTGVHLKEGFGIAMPKIIMGDDSGKDYHRSNKFIEEDSRDFTDKYFNSKKCGIGSGIGGITMFGSNELIGDERKVTLSGIYNFDEYYVTNNNDTDNIAYSVGSCDVTCKEARRWFYFNQCVFDPIKRNDFRSLKTIIYDNVNNYIINITGILQRFNTTILFNTQNDPNSDYSTRISLSSQKDNTELTDKYGIKYVSLIRGDKNTDKLKNIQSISNDDNINDKQYSELLSKINNNRNINSGDKQRQLEIYSKVYEFRKRIDSIFSNMRSQTKDDAGLMYTVRVGESVVQELRMMLSYLAMIKVTNDIILFEKNVGTSNNGIYNMITTNNPNRLIPILPDDKDGKYKSNIIGADNNIFKIPLEDDSYNNNNEMRYLYGITYYFDKINSKPIGM